MVKQDAAVAFMSYLRDVIRELISESTDIHEAKHAAIEAEETCDDLARRFDEIAQMDSAEVEKRFTECTKHIRNLQAGLAEAQKMIAEDRKARVADTELKLVLQALVPRLALVPAPVVVAAPTLPPEL